jgi:hypothetical protein
MRRILSICLLLVLGLGPVMAAVPADALALAWAAHGDDSVLPACCRRHGAHHCAMGAQDGNASNGFATVSATGCCPCWPHTLASSATPLATLASQKHSLAMIVEIQSPHQALIAAGISDRRSWPMRGPPFFKNI